MTAFALPSVTAAPRAGLGRLADAVRDAYMRHQTRQALTRLDAHLLRDIGLTPDDVPPVEGLPYAAFAPW